LTKHNACRRKKQSQILNTQSSQLTPTFKTGNTKEGKNCLLERCLLGYEDYKEQLLASMQTTRWWQQQQKKKNSPQVLISDQNQT